MKLFSRPPEVGHVIVEELAHAYYEDGHVSSVSREDMGNYVWRMMMGIERRFNTALYDLVGNPLQLYNESQKFGLSPMAIAIRQAAGVAEGYQVRKEFVDGEIGLEAKSEEANIVRTNMLLIMCGLVAPQTEFEPLFVSRMNFTHERASKKNPMGLMDKGDITDRRRRQLAQCASRFGFNSEVLVGPRVAAIVERHANYIVQGWKAETLG